MPQFQNFWRIVTPASRKQLYTTLSTDAYDPRATDMSSMTAVTWYSRVLSGHGSRMGTYKQYDAMDADVDIARSLDIIAEEMSGKDEKTQLPFIIDYQKEDNQEVSDTTVITLRQAVRQWSKDQNFSVRIFEIARCLIKYGDCFFRKLSDSKQWVYVHPSLVHGIEVDALGNKIAYHIRQPDVVSNRLTGRNEQHDVVPAAAMVHFTMSSDMGDTAPFGASVLRPIYRVYRQLSMIEDAVIIYRIVRAPERRVFYVDVGNMAPNRVKVYLEQIKNEIRQKRVPGQSTGGKDIVDGQYDPMSIQEDMFFPVTAAGRGSKVETLPGGTEDFGTNLLKYFKEKVFRGLRIPTSYMSGNSDGQPQQYNDGKVGIAYVEEMRFASFIRRLQDRLDDVFDQEFKVYLKVMGLKIDDEIFRIRLPDPANFALYRQAALDAELIQAFNNVSGAKILAMRFILKRYLGLTDDEIQMNEVMLREERGITDNSSIPALQQMYDPAVFDNREAITVEPEEQGAAPAGDEGGLEGGFFGGREAPGETAPNNEPVPTETPGGEEEQ